jgi:hypothetical protein
MSINQDLARYAQYAQYANNIFPRKYNLNDLITSHNPGYHCFECRTSVSSLARQLDNGERSVSQCISCALEVNRLVDRMISDVMKSYVFFTRHLALVVDVQNIIINYCHMTMVA